MSGTPHTMDKEDIPEEEVGHTVQNEVGEHSCVLRQSLHPFGNRINFTTNSEKREETNPIYKINTNCS